MQKQYHKFRKLFNEISIIFYGPILPTQQKKEHAVCIRTRSLSNGGFVQG